jgi:hypothetical protein
MLAEPERLFLSAKSLLQTVRTVLVLRVLKQLSVLNRGLVKVV